MIILKGSSCHVSTVVTTFILVWVCMQAYSFTVTRPMWLIHTQVVIVVGIITSHQAFTRIYWCDSARMLDRRAAVRFSMDWMSYSYCWSGGWQVCAVLFSCPVFVFHPLFACNIPCCWLSSHCPLQTLISRAGTSHVNPPTTTTTTNHFWFVRLLVVKIPPSHPTPTFILCFTSLYQART